MYIDPRVAHARAKLQLNDRAVTPEAFDDGVCSAIWRCLSEINSRGMAGRALRRHLATYLVPALERVGMRVTVDTVDGKVAIHAWATVCDAEHGVRGLSYYFETGYPDVVSGTWFSITPHAVARCLQRNRAWRVSEIRIELMVASALARVMLHVVRECGWRQAFVPTPLGLFIGSFDETMGLEMRTYIQPGANGRDTKWLAVQAGLPAMPPASTLRKESDLDIYIDTITDWVESEKASLIERHAFLSAPYERTTDPLNEAWRALRA